MAQTTVVNVSYNHLRKNGYVNFSHWFAQKDTEYIGGTNANLGVTSSVFRNPFPLRIDNLSGRQEVLYTYISYLENHPEIKEAAANLAGCQLGCFCAPELCHGHALKEIADGDQ